MSAIAFEGYDPGKAYMVGELPYRSRLGKLDFPLYAGRKMVGAMRSDVSSFIAGGVDSPCYRCTAWSREYLGSFEEVSDESGFVYREHIPFGSHPDIALIAPAGDADYVLLRVEPHLSTERIELPGDGKAARRDTAAGFRTRVNDFDVTGAHASFCQQPP